MTWPLKLNFHHQILSTLAVKKSFIYIIERPRYKGVLGQFVAGQFVADNSSQDNSSRTTRRRTIRRGQLVADNSSQHIKLSLQKVLLPFQQHSFHQSCFDFSNFLFITPTSISATLLSSLPLSIQQYLFHHSRLHFCSINPASISATFF